MRKSLSILFLLVIFLTTTVASSVAGGGHYGHGRSYYHGHSHHSGHLWAGLGVGLLSGMVIGSVLYPMYRERTIIYQSPQPVVVYSDPVILSSGSPPPPTQPQLVLRRVVTTPELLNVRSGPDLNASVFDQVPRNTLLDVLGAAPEWLYIRTETGQYGWIMTRYSREAEGPVG